MLAVVTNDSKVGVCAVERWGGASQEGTKEAHVNVWFVGSRSEG